MDDRTANVDQFIEFRSAGASTALTSTQMVLLFLVCVALQIGAFPSAFIQPQLNSEDGAHIYVDALQWPFWRTWLAPLYIPGQPPEGYVLLAQRMAGSFAASLPPEFGPAGLYLATYVIHVLLAMFFVSKRFGELVPSKVLRAAITLFIVLLPTVCSYRGSITGSVQYIAVPVMAMFAVLRTTRTRPILDCLFLLLCGLSAPSIVILVPLFILRFLVNRDRYSLAICSTVVIVSSFQMLMFFLSSRAAESDPSRLFALGPASLFLQYCKITLLREAGGAFLGTFGIVEIIRTFTGQQLLWMYLLLMAAFCGVIFMLSEINGRLRYVLLYLLLVPHVAGIFFYATKKGMRLEDLTGLEISGERYFYAAIASIGIITIIATAKSRTRFVAGILSLGLVFAASGDFAVPARPDYDYYNWSRQAKCIQGMRDHIRGECWLTFYAGALNGWKRSVTTPVQTEILPSLGTADLAEYSVGYDPNSHIIGFSGWAADPKGPTYPATVFVAADGVGDFQQSLQFNRIDVWEKLGGRARNDDMHSLGFTIGIPVSSFSDRLASAEFVRLTLKIAAFDLSGYYTTGRSYCVKRDFSIEMC